MPKYTVQIEASAADGTIWQALTPSENVESDDTAIEVAREVAYVQTVAEGGNWRVRVWEGNDADTDTEPAAEHVAGTSIDDLARQIADQHGIDTHTAAVDVVTVHVDQIRDDADLWDDTTDTLTPAGVDLVTGAISQSYSVGAVATAAAILLTQIEDAAAAIRATEHQLTEQTATRDDLIRKALKTTLRRADIAAAAGFRGPERLYQIRDGRR